MAKWFSWAGAQGKDLADKLKEIGDEFGSGLAELQEGALCTAASTGVDSLDCCNDRSGSAQKLAHRFDLPDDAQARPAGQRNAVPQEKRLAGKKKTLAENGQFASQSTLAGVVPQPHSRGHVRQESAASQASTAAGHRDQYGLGILWLTRNSKLICAGFAPGSPAREAGVRSGDILKAVDSVGDMSQHYQDILNMKVDGKTGKHAAGELMLGAQGTSCLLQLLRVQQTLGEDGQPQANDPSAVKLTEVRVTVPRMLKAESFSTQHF